MPAAKLNLYIEQGSTFKRTFRLRVGDASSALVNLTGYGVRSQIRATAQSAAVMLTPTVSVESPGTLGEIPFTVSAEASSALALSGSTFAETTSAAWDLELVNLTTQEPIRLLNGIAEISPEVTKDAN